jgi:hypothetical protein
MRGNAGGNAGQTELAPLSSPDAGTTFILQQTFHLSPAMIPILSDTFSSWLASPGPAPEPVRQTVGEVRPTKKG